MNTFQKDKRYLIHYWRYLKKYSRSLSLGLILIPAISFFHLLQPFLIKHGIDENLLKGDVSGLYETALFFTGCVILEFLCRCIQSYLFQYIGLKTITEIRSDLFRHIIQLSSSYFDKTPLGTLTSRVISDTEALNESVASGLVTLLGDLLTLSGIIVFMYILSPKLTLIVLLILPFLMLISNFFRIKLRHYFTLIRTMTGKLNAMLQEQLQAVFLIQIFGRIQRNIRSFKELNASYKKANIASAAYDALLYSVIETLASIMIALMIWYGWGQYQKGAVTLGLLVAFIEYIHKFFNPLKELSNKFAVLQHALAALEKIFGLFDIEDNDDHATIREFQTDFRSMGAHNVLPPHSAAHGMMPISTPDLGLWTSNHEIIFKNVSYVYPGHADKPVLRDISFTLHPEHVVAIVGPTGSGKTTIGRLLTRLYDGYSGSITLDGIDISTLTIKDLRRKIAVVTQDTHLFTASIRYNITLGNPKITQEKMIEAAKAVQIHDTIMGFENGYDTFLEGRGSQLSAGQAQLISFARAAASDAPVIVLDEATASVDPLSEKRIQNAIQKLFLSKTVLVIAHRLSTIQKADKILCVKNGEIIEKGTHEELMKKDGFYAKLFQMQFAHPASL